MDLIAVGVDIGGSHISCAAVDLESHCIIEGTGCEQKINNKAGPDEILEGWAGALSATIKVIDKTKLAGIGFAMPGPFDYSKGIALFERVGKYESLYGINVSEQLRKRLNLDLGVRLRYINDATAFAISEAWIGKASHYDKMIALTLGTGFGSAFVTEGVPVLSGDHVPAMGCLWHIPYQDGIANDYFSTSWFLGKFQEKTGIMAQGVKEIADRADSEPFVLSLFKEYGYGMGEFITPWIRRFGAKVIVIGGNIAGAFHLFGDALSYSLSRNNAGVEIYLSELKENAAIIGGARLLVDDYWIKVKDLLSNM